jgi:MFS family permease
VVVDLIGFGIIMPTLPFYAEALGASATTLGLIFASYAAAQFVCAPLWGRLSDRIGRRPVLLVTIAGTGLSLLGLALAHSLGTIFAARIAGGVFAANVSVAAAYVTDVTPEEERTRWMGLLGACFGVGFVLGPALAGGLGVYGKSVPLFAAAGLSGLNLVWAASALGEPPRQITAGGGSAAGRLSVLRDPRIRLLCGLYLAFSVAVTQLETMFAYFMQDRFGYDLPRVAFIFVGMAVVMGGVQGGGMKALSARFQERTLAIAGSLVLAGAFAALPGIHSVTLLLVPLTLAALGRGVAQPSMMSLASFSATPRNRGVVMGTFQSSASLARVFGPVLAGTLYDRSIGAPFLLASALLAGVALIGRAMPERPLAEGRG